MKLKAAVNQVDPRRFHIEGLGEVSLYASVWEDLASNTISNDVEKLRVGQSGEWRFSGSYNLGRTKVRRVQ